MRLIDIYDFVIKKGIAKDPRTKKEIDEELNKARREFRNLRGPDKKYYDKDRLENPYADTRILYGNPDEDIKTMMIGVDMEVPEVLAADRLNERGESIDLVMAHHPEGAAWARFYDVMRLQVAMLRKFGIPPEIGKALLEDRIGEVERAVSPANHMRAVDVARLLDMPFMCVHTPADNHVADYLQKIFDRKRPENLSRVLNILKNIPEYQDGIKKNTGPRILIGKPDKKAGRIFVDMTGGTEGPKKIFARLSQAGVGTIVSMHLSEEHYKNAKDEHINIIIAGHIASDTLGINLLLDELQKQEKFRIIPCSGFVRVRR
ncbi:MAG: NGG1p interacting factor NIF3 [Omnitrophica bacterium RIFCSPLOWO2_01_FULL_45_10]|nr:MAG: NGG1p interacting factor NIF3 [Omnitrophica bacterium RIFCSPLOWO2_01_FULL_45_10]